MTQKPFEYSGVSGTLDPNAQQNVQNQPRAQVSGMGAGTLPSTLGFTLQDVGGRDWTPSTADLNLRAPQTNIQMPSLAVYTPDYGNLEASFNQIMQSFGEYRKAAEAQFGAQKSSMDLNLERQLQSVERAKETTEKQYGKGRQQLAEDIFMANRQTQRALSSRGLSGSGVEALANIQNRMAAGEAVSNLANQFFDAQTQLVEAEQSARQNYDVSLQSLNASLQATMAQIMSQEASTQMNYTQQVEALKRQVVADTNAVKQYESQWQMAQQQLEEGRRITNSMVQRVLSEGGTPESRASMLMDFNYTYSEAMAEVMKFDNALQSQQQNMMTQMLQQEVNNLRSQGVSEKNIKTRLKDDYGSAVNFDALDFNAPISPAATSSEFPGLFELGRQQNELIQSYVNQGIPYQIAVRMASTGTTPGQR